MRWSNADLTEDKVKELYPDFKFFGEDVVWRSMQLMYDNGNKFFNVVDFRKVCQEQYQEHVRQLDNQKRLTMGDVASLNAGGLCHKESGFIQELCEKVSLICRQNTWIDGSLADHGWWSQWINICREKFPWYRIAIFYVYCTPDKVFERALARGKKTGRYVPKEMLQSSIDKTAKSVEILGPIMKSKKTLELLHSAEKKKNIKAIILRIDSPGGRLGQLRKFLTKW